MNQTPHSKIVGAFVLGLALVAGAYVTSNFGQPSNLYQQNQAALATEALVPARAPIDVTDTDNNGIEDWRDEFITTEPIVLDAAESGEPYEPPKTITGRMGIGFVQDIVRARNYGGIGRTEEQVIADTIQSLEVETAHTIYDVAQITIRNESSPEIIKNYANAVASAIIENSKTDLENELLILTDITNRNDRSRLKEIEQLAEIYRVTRDAIILIPVPNTLVKEHLDLINTLHAVHNDIIGMSLTFDDPAYALLRLKRYEDDALGLSLALQNLYTAFVPYASLFTINDSAVYFTTFAPSSQVRI